MLESKCFKDFLDSRDELVWRLADLFSPLPVGSLRAVEDKEREEGTLQEGRTSEEESAQMRVLSLSTVLHVKEPDRGIDANAIAAHAVAVVEEAIGDSEVCQGACDRRWPEYLKDMGDSPSS